MVIGGGKPGMRTLEGKNEILRQEMLVERCEFWMSDEFIREIGI